MVLLIVFLGGGPGDPKEAAQQVVAGMNAKDADALADLTCEKERDSVRENIDKLDLSKNPQVPPQMKNMSVNFTLGEVKEIDDSNATAQVKLKFENVPAELSAVPQIQNPPALTMKLVDEDGWKVCDVDTGGL